MKRRNFIGSLLAIGAGFSILPPATTYGRIWTAEKKVIIPDRELKSIWQTYYMSWNLGPEDRPPTQPAKNGEVVKLNRDGTIWYKHETGWCLLHKHRRPLTWNVSAHLFMP